jgi:hypothetical protein
MDVRDMATHGSPLTRSQRSLLSGPNLSEAPPACKWTQRPYLHWPPREILEDLIQIPEIPRGLEHKASYKIIKYTPSIPKRMMF